MRFRTAPLAGAALAALFTWPVPVAAQPPPPFATGLKAPTKIVLTPGGNLLVSEAGDYPGPPPAPAFVANGGRVSLVQRDGSHWPLLEGLPSGLDLDNVNPTGPSGLSISSDRTLYLEIGQGDSIKRNASGGEAPNPSGISSAILSSLWRVRFSDPVDSLRGGFALDPATHYPTLADGREVRLVNAFDEEAWVRVVADLRDLYPVPQPPPPAPPNPNRVSGSNPFGLLRLGDDFYLPDAGQNSLVKIDRESGRAKTIVHFPPVPNTAGFGPPFSQAVPNSIRRLPGRDCALVTLLTGFPFNQGASSVQVVDLSDWTAQPFISGLTMAIDVLGVAHANGPFLVLEHASRFDPSAVPPFVAPGRLLRFDRRTAAPTVVANTLITPTSMAYDPATRELFVTEIRTGRIIRIQL
jgi:hypothetical protein